MKIKGIFLNFTSEFAVAARHALWSCGISPQMTHNEVDAVKSLAFGKEYQIFFLILKYRWVYLSIFLSSGHDD